MSSTAPPENPPTTTISASLPSPQIYGNDGVQVDREVVVTSHEQPMQRSNSSPHVTQSRLLGRAQSHDLLSSQPATTLRPNPRLSGKTVDRYSSPDLDRFSSAYPDPSRESMKALAEFLMNNTPPPNNWVSVPSDDEMSLRTIKKYKLFGLEHKKRKRVHKQQVSIQLPPSAVSARTRSGSRHIAISIPWEHDYQDYLLPSQPEERPHTAPRLYTSDRGTVTVLKPVAELRESTPVRPLSRAKESFESRPNTPPNIVLGPEATRTLENYYQRLHRQQLKSKQGSSPGKHGNSPVKHSNSPGKRCHSPVKQAHIASSLDKSKIDQRMSAGTTYSTTTYSTMLGHSRGASSISTAPSMGYFASNRMDSAPPRKSSKANGTVSVEEELSRDAFRPAALETTLEESTKHPLKSVSGSLNSSASSIRQPTVLVIATADLARGYKSPGPQYLSRTSTPITVDAPTKKLPDLPSKAQVRPASAPLSRNNSSVNTTVQTNFSLKRNTSHPPQSRQDRVKAKKLKDLAASRASVASVASEYFPFVQGDSRPQTPEVATASLKPDLHDTPIPIRSHLRKSSQDVAYRKSLNRLSPIMVVASLPPYTGLVLASDLPSPRNQYLQKSNNASINTVTSIIHTPPRSVLDDCGQSDSDTIPTRPHSVTRSYSPRKKLAERSSTSSDGSSNSALEARRQERRSKRNMTLHERELDRRVARLEKDNALLLSTLKTIAGSFGVLNRLLPEGVDGLAGVGAGHSRSKSIVEEMKDGDAGVETLVKDLQRRTSRASATTYDAAISRVEQSGRVRLEENE